MKRYTLILLFSVLLFSGCATSYMGVKQDTYRLEHNKVDVFHTENITKEKGHFFPNIFVDAYLLEDKGETLRYEYVTLDNRYMFIYGDLATLEFIFDARGAHIIYQDSVMMLVQLKLEDDRYLNVAVEFNVMDEMKYTYGFSHQAFLALAEKLNEDAQKKLKTLKKDVVTFKAEDDALSTWSVEMLFKNKIIGVKARRGAI